MLIQHISLLPKSVWRWPSFSPNEPNLACPCCDEFYLDIDAMDKLQHARTIVGKAFRINSGHRCALHNARVGGAPLSQHKKIAFDISLAGHNRKVLYNACKVAGFGSFGFYQTFLHVDTRPGRRWYSNARAKQSWNF